MQKNKRLRLVLETSRIQATEQFAAEPHHLSSVVSHYTGLQQIDKAAFKMLNENNLLETRLKQLLDRKK